jgi:hypothetical protein
VAALSAKPLGSRRRAGKAKGYDTNDDTTQILAELPASDVIEKMVGPWRLELQTSTVSKAN